MKRFLRGGGENGAGPPGVAYVSIHSYYCYYDCHPSNGFPVILSRAEILPVQCNADLSSSLSVCAVQEAPPHPS